jgi:hypothetical protein
MDRELIEEKISGMLDEYEESDHKEPKKEEPEGHVSQPAMVTRQIAPHFNYPRFEVRSLDRNDAEMGRPIFVLAEPGLEQDVDIGDVVVLFGEGNKLRIVDIDLDFPRAGETATIIGVHPDSYFRYELELEGDSYLARRLDALKWGRLEKNLQIGDRVKVMGGVIHSLAPGKEHSRFIVYPRDDLDRSDLHGGVPNLVCDLILAETDRNLHCEKYPARTSRFGSKTALLLYGPPGVGKSFSVSVACSILKRKYNNGGAEKIVFLGTEGSAIDGALVGSGPKALREIRSLAQKAIAEGKFPFTFVNEAGSLLRSREIQNMQLDGGSSLATHEQLLAMLSGPNEIPGLVIVDTNFEKNLDEATRQRFTCIGYPHIDRGIMIEKMFKTTYEKEKSMFEGKWKGFREALYKSLDTGIGTVMVGSETCPVTTGHLTSGRMYEQVMLECIRLVDLLIYKAYEYGDEPMFSRITGPLMYYTLTKRAWSLFKCWDVSEARERLVPEIARREKASSINNPSAYEWHDIKMSSKYDCRDILDWLTDENFEEFELAS